MGRNTSVPLSLICTDWDGVDRVHNFLCKYDPFNVLKEATSSENEDILIGGEYAYGLEGSYPYEDDDKENDDDEMRELRYSKIAEFKSISDQLSASFGSSASESNSIPRGPAAHVSKYDKNQPKLKSKTRLFALPCHAEVQGMKHSRPHADTSKSTHGIQTLNRRGAHLYSTLYDAADVNFDYLSILKSSQKLAVLAVEKKERSILDSLLAFQSISSLDESTGTKVDSPEVCTIENEKLTTENTLNEKSEIDLEKVGKQELQSPYRNLITSSLAVLGGGLIEREVEVSENVLHDLYGRGRHSIDPP